MNLTKEQQDLKNDNCRRLCGRMGIVFKPYYTILPSNTPITIIDYNYETELFEVLYDSPEGTRRAKLLRDEFQLTDLEFSGYKILKKGIRALRKDKYNNDLVLELSSKNAKEIELSHALTSILKTEDKTHIGFAFDPDTKTYYISATKPEDGYEIDKNNRINNPVDYMELQKMFNTNRFNVDIMPIIDNENNPDTIFYRIMPEYNNYREVVKSNYKTEDTGIKFKSKELLIDSFFFQPSSPAYTITQGVDSHRNGILGEEQEISNPRR